MWWKNYLVEPILDFIDARDHSWIWNVCLLSCQERHIIPIRASNKAQVGAYIRSHIPHFMIFFEHLALCYSEQDSIAIDLQDYLLLKSDAQTISPELIALILQRYTDEEIVTEFYGLQMDNENSFKICIDQPKELISLVE